MVAIASLIGGIFGRGGGNELDSALTMQAFAERFGKKAGRKAWLGFRSKNDPEAPTTVSQEVPLRDRQRLRQARPGPARPGSVSETPIAKASSAVPGAGQASAPCSRRAARRRPRLQLGAGLGQALRDGHPIAVMGPQVGYYVPQILMEEDLHGPGIDARGAAFAGVNLASSSATAATTPGARPPRPPTTSTPSPRSSARTASTTATTASACRWKSWSRPTAGPRTRSTRPKPGSQTLTAYRTVHGIVFARGKVDGKKVAFVHRAQHLLPRGRLGDRLREAQRTRLRHRPSRFKKAVSKISFLFNWAYVDSEHIAYALSGAMPQRAKDTSPDFPILGTGQYDWKGFKPATQTATYLPFSKHPQAVDPDYLVSWNNKQAPEWAAADDQYAYGPLFRSQMIADRVKAGIKGNEKMTIAQLVQAMEEPASEDIRGNLLLPTLLKAIGKPKSPALKEALATLSAWNKAGAHRRDLDRDGVDEETPAIELMDAWWPKLVTRRVQARRWARRPSNGSRACSRSATRSAARRTRRPSPTAGGATSTRTCATSSGPSRRAPYSRVYCGKGSKSKCRSLLQRTLREAMKVTPAQLYGGGNGKCAANPQPACFDQNRPTVTRHPAGAVPVPEPADVPAGGDADPEAAALSGGEGSVRAPRLRTTAGRFVGRGLPPLGRDRDSFRSASAASSARIVTMSGH